MNVRTKHYINIGLAAIMCVLILTCNQCFAEPEVVAGITLESYGRGIVPLTKGSSTTLQNTNGQARSVVTVLALGQGTLKATLSKKDTTNDVVSLLLIGYPAEPAFVPGFGITPADVTTSAAITDALGGYGVFFIITTVNSTKTYASSLSLKLE